MDMLEDPCPPWQSKLDFQGTDSTSPARPHTSPKHQRIDEVRNDTSVLLLRLVSRTVGSRDGEVPQIVINIVGRISCPSR